MRVLWQCESDPYCRAVLRKHWPDIPCFEDVKTLLPDAELAAGGQQSGRRQARPVARDGNDGYGVAPVDLLCGGLPCQPVSLAGRRRGSADDRWLWPEFARLIRLLRPRYALMENVPGLLVGGGMGEVLGDLAALGYDAEWDCVAAAHVGAPHLRYRVFIVAYAQRDAGELRQPATERQRRSPGGGAAVADSDDTGSQGRNKREWSPGQRLAWASGWPNASQWLIEPDVGRVAHGVPSRVDRLRALGNAVVPQVAEVIGRLIVQQDTHLRTTS